MIRVTTTRVAGRSENNLSGGIAPAFTTMMMIVTIVYCRTVPRPVIARASVSSSNVAPWRERIFDAFKGNLELRMVPEDNFLHSSSTDPF